jgi:beta-lactamase regulating signal transducer with metallopeptidase domain
MAAFLIQSTLSNLIVATLIACLAWIIQRKSKSASLANLLWALVLIKLVTPPLITLPIVAVPNGADTPEDREIIHEIKPGELANPKSIVSGTVNVPALSESGFLGIGSGARKLADRGNFCIGLALAIWFAGTAILAMVSLIRIFRFHRLLDACSRVSNELSDVASQVAHAFGIRVRPRIIVTAANVTPFVWWILGRTIIVVPESAVQKLEPRELRLLIAHEVAHIKRRDHYFRWVEWAAIILFWWNPVVWWARRELRISEELACDEIVIETTRETKYYAQSLLNMAELLTISEIRPPVMASAFNSGGNLENRLKMIIAEKNHSISSRLRTAILAVAACLFPLGLVYAQDFEAVERRLGLAVHEGELSLEHAHLMMEALRDSVHEKKHDEDDQMEARKRRYTGIVERMKDAVRRGEISEKEAENKLVEVREEIFGDVEDDEMEARKRRYMGIVERVKDAVRRGEISELEAENKLVEVRKEMFGDVEDDEMEARKRRYMGIVERVKNAVRRGEISEQEAEDKLDEVREKIFGDDEDDEIEARKRRYMGIVERVKDAVRRGEISEQEAENKLVEVRKEVFGDNEAEENDERGVDDEMEERRERYMAVERRVKAAVDRGDMSEVEAERKLIEIRKDLFGDDDE